MERFVLELVTDESYSELIGRKKKFRYKEGRHFIAFRSKPDRLKKNLRRNIKRFLQSPDARGIVLTRLYRETQAAA